MRGFPYGEDFRYDEMMLTSPGDAGKAAANAVTELLKNPFGAKPPKPGEGPTPEERENGFYDIVFRGEYTDGKALNYGVKGRYDPGYGSTSRMLAETGHGAARLYGRRRHRHAGIVSRRGAGRAAARPCRDHLRARGLTEPQRAASVLP